MNLLEEARQEIDQIDQAMTELFLQRMEAVKKVVAHKQAHNLPILDSSREGALIEKNMARLSTQQQELYGKFYQDFLINNMNVSKAFQKQLIAKDKVAYQGVPGAFSHLVKEKLFPQAPEIPFESWEEVFQAVEDESVAYGVLPFENSHSGDVSQVLDLCYAHPQIHVNTMYDLPVHHNLLALEGATLEDIKTVYSHPQALSQCAKFLQNYQLKPISYHNTAAAATHISQLQDKSVAAIASEETAKLYNLNVLAPHINEAEDNTTRFLVISKETPQIGNRFSLLFTITHQTGSLAQVITLVAKEGFNMESIKSRPMPHVSWEYYFYMELVGDAPSAQNLQKKLESVCHSVRILGIYNREES